MSKAPPKRYRIAMTVKDTAMPTIFELLRDEATDFTMLEVLPDQKVRQANGAVRNTNRPRAHQGAVWVMELWPVFEPVIRQIGDVHYTDQRLIDVLTKAGHSPNSISAVISAFERNGKLKRVSRGVYALV